MEKVTIGADPEFVIRIPNTSEIVSGDYITKFNGAIGTDAVDELIELRPNPSTNVFNVLGNIRYMLRFLLDKSPELKKLEFVAGHQGVHFPIGGHIHIGRVSKKIWFNNMIIEDSAPSCGRVLISLLDKLLYDGVHKAIRDKAGYDFRVNHSYGFKGNYRVHTKSVVEYRTPPSWLVSPTLAFLYLCLAKVGGLLVINYPDTTTEILAKKSIGVNILKLIANKIENISDMINQPDIEKLVSLIRDIKFKTCQNVNWSIDFKKSWGL
jgi:hypothetical protein